MIVALRIKNFALVEEATIEFSPGFNAITGETGAGKSILIGALSLLLGERADRSAIRSGSDYCSIEAVFDIGKLAAQINQFLESAGIEPCQDNQLIIKRTIMVSGATRQYVNGSPSTLSTLEGLGNMLVDIHGAYEHQSLLKPVCQLALLDSFGGLEKQRAEYEALVKKFIRIQEQIKSLVMDEQTFSRELDLLRFQVEEIKMANLSDGEDQLLEDQYRRAANSAKLAQLCAELQQVFADSDESLLNKLNIAGRILNEIYRADASVENLLIIHRDLVDQVQEFNRLLIRYADNIEINEEQLSVIESRLDLINSLKKKYGPKLADVVAYGKEAEEKLNRLLHRNEELEQLGKEREKTKNQIINAARKLSSERKKVAPELAKRINAQLPQIGFRQPRFEIKIDFNLPDFVSPPPLSGCDTVEFLISPNPGEPLKPLRAIASSGELARVMLALKTALADHDLVPVLIFDEVDANIGGETATAVGKKMKQLGSRHQVLCITHLATVAAWAQSHYLVKKEVKDQRTYTFIERLEGEDRVYELARMLGGRSEISVEHAKALLKNRD